MAISRGQLVKELEPGLNALFGLEYKRYENQHAEIFATENSDRAFEEEVMLSGFANAQVKPEGSGVTFDNAQETFTARYTHETIALAFSITEEAIEDNLYDRLASRYTKALARSMANTKQVKAANVLNNAFNSSFAGGDGKELCATDHPTIAGTFKNELSTSADLNETSLEQSLIDIAALTDERATQPLIKHVFSKGGNATVFAYGQTGSGKTYTMVAMQNRAAEEIFQNLQQEGNLGNTKIICTFFEIYGGRCIDLLNRRKKLTIREDGKGNVVVGGLCEEQVTTKEELLECIARGNSSRATHATEMNAVSSRSHAICRIAVRFPDRRGNGMFSLIDLAGSERGQDTKNHNRQRRVEGAEINKSLLALKECIRAMRAKRRLHIPYRASKLTLVLKESFSPQSRTTMICNIAPTASSTEHTLNTLRYANRVKEKEVVHYFEGTMAPGGGMDENNKGQNIKHNVGAHANNSFGDVLEEDDSDDTIGESMLSPPLSPTARRLHKANVLAREGKISEHEKIKMKEDVIRKAKSKNAVNHVRAPTSTNNRRSPRVKLPPTGRNHKNNRMGRHQQQNKYEGKMDDNVSVNGRNPRSNDRNNNNRNRRHASPPGQKEETKKTSGPNHPRGNNSKRRIITHSSENSPLIRGSGNNNSNQRHSNSKLKKPNNSHQKKIKKTKAAAKVKEREDLQILHRSLRAQGEGESSSHLEDLHEAISQLVDEEENLLQLHMDTIQENAQLLTEEGNLLAKVQGEDVVDYDIDVYAERLDNILERKIKMYTELQKNLKTFRSHLAEEETLSAAYDQQQNI